MSGFWSIGRLFATPLGAWRRAATREARKLPCSDRSLSPPLSLSALSPSSPLFSGKHEEIKRSSLKGDEDADDSSDLGGDENAMSVVPTPSAPTPQNAVVFSPQLLRVYYDRLFPFQYMYDWLAYGNDFAKGNAPGNVKDFFARREWSFTIQPTPEDEIYIRYQSFKNCQEFKEAVQKRQVRAHREGII